MWLRKVFAHYASTNDSRGELLDLRELLLMFKDLGLAHVDAAAHAGGAGLPAASSACTTLSLSSIARTAVAATSFIGAPGVDRMNLDEFVEVLYYIAEAHTNDGLQPPLTRAEHFMHSEFFPVVKSRTKLAVVVS